jgi:hypothetical protein
LAACFFLARDRRGRAGSGAASLAWSKPSCSMLAAKCSGSSAVTSSFPPPGMVDDQAARVEVHLAADRAGQERLLPAVLAVADDRVADRRHVDAQLVGAAGQRLQLDPGGAVAGAVDTR